MDHRRSWPWKKKSGTEKAVAVLEAAADDAFPSSIGSQKEQDDCKKPNYIQISIESYTHLTGLEEQVKSLEDTITELNEELSASQLEIATKETLVKQHSKVAEHAVSGWEKAEAEVSVLKNHLESATLLKLAAEDRGSQLDGALKECMKQILNLKEEHEQELIDVVHSYKNELDKVRIELEGKISNLDRKLAKSEAENATLSRSLQERSDLLIKLCEEKSQANAEIEKLKGNIELCQKEMNSLKYEHHIVKKELEIRNEEKNMSVKSSEVANKNHLEGVKKIAKLEAECQRLRGLVRKKLPGPAALAKMKLEVEKSGSDNRETTSNEFLTERIFTIEEETKMLKETLATRNSELQVSREKLQSLESRIKEDDNRNASIGNNLILMDDFLEMEKLAYSTNEEITAAISQIHEFVSVLNKEASHKLITSSKSNLVDFVIDLSHVLSKANEDHFNVLSYKNNETTSSDCIDKIALPSPIDDLSDPDIPKCSFEEFQQLKLEKEKLLVDLEANKNQLIEAEQIRVEIKSQLESSRKMNGLSETQLKCMAESYNALEKREEDLKTEVKLLQIKIESIDNDLQEEKRNHHDALARFKDLQEQLQRMESSVAETESKNQQEKNIAAASEKLVECQETIFLLGKQLKAMRPQADYMSLKHHMLSEQEPISQDIEFPIETTTNFYNQSCHSDAEISTSPVNTKRQSRHRTTKSSSSYSSSIPTPEKHSHGFSRFFMSKSKYDD
ncbi:filament-like plant protein 4 [Impatiens glandulifera]|uniref:filament-like plant protein 4 n=1 Tax=Impatiens glandulifera TaxID=253017 RepID=UPI001FB0CFED|nr:filament-like plant protein 4 [Impatiens glandulifera]